MPQIIKNLRLNKAALLVTTSMVIAGCNTVDQQNQSADATPDPIISEASQEGPKTGLSQNRLMRVANRAWEQGNPGTALRLYNMAVEKNPKAKGPYLAAANILRKTKRAEAAIDVYKGILKNHPDSLEAHRGIGYSLLALEKPYLASQSFEAAISLDPQNSKSLGGMAVALDTAGEHEKAQDYYRLAIKADPNNLTYQNNLALSLALIGRIDQAIAMLEIITAHPNATAKHRQNLALVYGMAGKSADAMRFSRMDLSEKDARNNALYFQALNSPPTSQVADQKRQTYVMAMARSQKRKKAAPEATLHAFAQLAARPEKEILAAATISIAENKTSPRSIIPQPQQNTVHYAKISTPVRLTTATTVQTRAYVREIVASPVNAIEVEALIVTAPEKAKTTLVSKVEKATFSIANISTPEYLYYAQVGAFRTKERAMSGWKNLLKRHGDLLDGFEPIFTKAELGPAKGGTFYRVRIGSFDTKSTPRNLCMSLRNRSQDCYMPRVSKLSALKSVKQQPSDPAHDPRAEDVLVEEIAPTKMQKDRPTKKDEMQAPGKYHIASISS